MIQLTLTLKMTTTHVVETSVTVNNNSPIQDYVHPDDQTQPFEVTPGFKPFTGGTIVKTIKIIHWDLGKGDCDRLIQFSCTVIKGNYFRD